MFQKIYLQMVFLKVVLRGIPVMIGHGCAQIKNGHVGKSFMTITFLPGYSRNQILDPSLIRQFKLLKVMIYIKDNRYVLVN